MRIFALSDLHADFEENLQWLRNLSQQDYQQDLLVLAGDISDRLEILEQVFSVLADRFLHVSFVPGNHELWLRGNRHDCSLEKFEDVIALANDCGIETGVLALGRLSIVPLLGWYDFSFGAASRNLRLAWRDFHLCGWPERMQDEQAITEYFLSRNEPYLQHRNDFVISFSHFLPRIDVMPDRIPQDRRIVYPVLGSTRLGEQVKALGPDIHVYGHSHVNRSVMLDGIQYINNAFAYPSERRISRKALHLIHEVPGD